MQFKVYVNLSLFINLLFCLSCMNFLRSFLLSNYNTVSLYPHRFTDVFPASNSFINLLIIFPQILTNGKQTKVVEFNERCKSDFYQEFSLGFHKYKIRSRYVTLLVGMVPGKEANNLTLYLNYLAIEILVVPCLKVSVIFSTKHI